MRDSRAKSEEDKGRKRVRIAKMENEKHTLRKQNYIDSNLSTILKDTAILLKS
jgi:hypothetical protein